MDNQPILSLCIPTNGAVEWVLPVLDSIYKQEFDLTQFEVVITDNGKDSQLGRYLNQYDFSNLRYIPTTDNGFLNLVTSLKKGRGLFCKMINHRSILLPGSIAEMVRLINLYKKKQPIIYFAGGISRIGDIQEYKNLDEFVLGISYFASWSAGIGFWSKDILHFDEIELDKMFPNSSLLFNVRTNSEYVIWNKPYMMMEDDAGKGGFNLFETWCVTFLDIINNLRQRNRISIETFLYVKKDLYKHLFKVYFDEVVLSTKHSFDLDNIDISFEVYYGKIYYRWLVFVSWMRFPLYFLKKAIRHILTNGSR